MNPDHTNTGQPERMHDAFISYSRRDRAFALKLEKALENYKPPKEVRASGRRLSVFRDETDFSGIEYEASIAHHLKGSAKLIVICSPNARSSAYVADEIRRFAAINGAANPGEFKSVSFSPDGSQVITALPDNTARIWDVASGRPVGEPLRHEGGVALAAFSPDGRWIVTTGDDNTAWIWNARAQQLIHGPLRHPHEPGLGGSLEAAFSPDGRQLVTA